MAGVEAHTHELVVLHSIKNARELLKGTPHFASLARHRLQQHDGSLPRHQNLVQPCADELDADVCTLLHMAPRVEIVHRSRKMVHAPQIVLHHIAGIVAKSWIGRARIERIGSVRKRWAEPVRLHQIHKSQSIGLVKRLRRSAARVTGKELEYVRANRKGILAHRKEALH